jgi:hypothetical protein
MTNDDFQVKITLLHSSVDVFWHFCPLLVTWAPGNETPGLTFSHFWDTEGRTKTRIYWYKKAKKTLLSGSKSCK